MSQLIAVVEKTKEGFGAYLENIEGVAVTALAPNLSELRLEIREALDFCIEDEPHLAHLAEQEIELRLEVSQIFEFYATLNLSAFAKFIGMNRSLLNQYATGIKRPSEKQSLRILEGIHRLGKDYQAISI